MEPGSEIVVETDNESLIAATTEFARVLPKFKKQVGGKDFDIVKHYFDPNTKDSKDPWRKVEPFTPIYRESVRQLYRIRPHTDPDFYPVQLFRNLSPHRRNDEEAWIEHNYESVTLPVWMDFQNSIKRGVDRKNYSITWPNEWPVEYRNENNPQDYLEDGIRAYGSVYNWFSNTLFDVKLKDANGVIAVQPYKMEMTTTEDGQVTSNGDRVEPVPVYYSSEKILAFEEDEHYLLLSEEKSLVEYNNKREKLGYVFYWFDQENIVRIQQKGKKVDWEFEAFIYLEHDWGSLPVWKLQGQPHLHGKIMYYQSPFDFAVGPLNLVLKNQINKQMAEANSAWPHKIMVADECDYKTEDENHCSYGRVMVDGVMSTCPKCNGTGLMDKPSPGSTLMVSEKAANEPSGVGLQRIAFVAPDAGILSHLESTIDKDETKARNILHMYSTNSQATGTDDTATGKMIDLRAMYAFIRPIIDEGFDILEGVIQAVVHMRYGDLPDKIKVNRPVNLDYKTSKDYLDEYLSLLEKGAPPIVVMKALETYIQSMFYNSDKDKKLFKLVLYSDPLAASKSEEIRNLVGSGAVQKWQAVLHYNIFSFIEQLIEGDKGFVDLDMAKQRAALEELAKSFAGTDDDGVNSLINGLTGNRQPGSAQNEPAGVGA